LSYFGLDNISDIKFSQSWHLLGDVEHGYL
jgi:hypothetical protein